MGFASDWGSPLLLGLITRGTLDPVILDLRPDWRVFSFAAAAAVLTGVLIGLVPAWQMSRQEPALVLRQRGAGRGQARSGKVLIVAQIALSLVLLFGAGLLLRTFENLRSSDHRGPASSKPACTACLERFQPPSRTCPCQRASKGGKKRSRLREQTATRNSAF